MKQTAIQQAIAMVRSRIDLIDETIMGKHTIHHLQQIERVLYDLLETEKQQIEYSFDLGFCEGYNYAIRDYNPEYISGEQYFKENYK
jgi:hypothetical protein